MANLIAALLGALAGWLAVSFGLSFHIGPWFVDGPWLPVASCVGGALVGVFVRYALSREFGWP